MVLSCRSIVTASCETNIFFIAGVLPFSATEVVSRQLSVTELSTGTRKKITADVDPSAKIKLQLFPVDEVTRIGLEKVSFLWVTTLCSS